MTPDFEDHISNRERAERFHAAIRSYHDEWDVEANLIDLLADARHWCDRLAYQHDAAEIVESRRGRP